MEDESDESRSHHNNNLSMHSSRLQVSQINDTLATYELEIDHVCYLESMLPKKYSFQLAFHEDNDENEESDESQEPSFHAKNDTLIKPPYIMVKRSMLPLIGILNQLKKSELAVMYRYPVNPIALKLPDYRRVIKNPMDLHTIEDNLNRGLYDLAEEVHEDLRLMIKNSHLYNQNNPQLYDMAIKFQILYKEVVHKFKTLQYIANAKKPREAASFQVKYRRLGKNKPKITRQFRIKTCKMFKSLSQTMRMKAIQQLNVQNNIKSNQIDFASIPSEIIQKLYMLIKQWSQRGIVDIPVQEEEPIQSEHEKADEEIIQNIENDPDYDS